MIRAETTINKEATQFVQTTTFRADTEEEWIKLEEMASLIPKKPIIYGGMIPLNPRTKKNSQKIIRNPRTKAPMIVQSEEYKQYEKDAGWFLKKPAVPISEPVNIRCLFYRDSRRRVDLTNLLEAIDDILVKYKIIADDNFEIIRGHDGSRVYIDKERPRVEIEITPCTE